MHLTATYSSIVEFIFKLYHFAWEIHIYIVFVCVCCSAEKQSTLVICDVGKPILLDKGGDGGEFKPVCGRQKGPPKISTS